MGLVHWVGYREYLKRRGFWGGFIGHIETGEGRSIGADLTDLLLVVVRVEDRGLSRDSGQYGASQEDMERHKAAGLCVSGSEKGHEHRNAKHAVRGPGAFSALPRWPNAAPAVYREVTKAGRGLRFPGVVCNKQTPMHGAPHVSRKSSARVQGLGFRV
jgi:hypothetical protein